MLMTENKRNWRQSFDHGSYHLRYRRRTVVHTVKIELLFLFVKINCETASLASCDLYVTSLPVGTENLAVV